MKGHLTDEALLAAAEAGLADRHPDGPTRGHVERCERCRARSAAIRQILEALNGPALERAPVEWVDSVRDGIAGVAGGRSIARTVAGKAPGIIEQIRMLLVLDTRMRTPLLGIRGATPTDSRRLLYEAESRQGSLHLQVERAAHGKAALRGQIVLPDPPARGRALLYVGTGSAPFERKLSPRGEFRFAAVPAGTVRLTVEVGESVFVTDELDVSGDPEA